MKRFAMKQLQSMKEKGKRKPMIIRAQDRWEKHGYEGIRKTIFPQSGICILL